MFDKLESLENRFKELEKLMSDPEIINDQGTFKEYSKEYSSLKDIIEKYNEYKKVKEDVEDARELLDEEADDEMKESFKQEVEELEDKKASLEEEIKMLMVPKDPNDDKNVFVEIRAGTGGDEAALFAGDLFRMYSKYAELNNWKVEIVDSHQTDMKGFKEVVFFVKGKGAFSKLKYESGVHRVQRIPSTESGGRIHTSTATVAVLPEAEDVDVEIEQKDLRIDTFCSTGPGGQSVNTTQSAVRITHEPTGIVVSCQDEKSQHKNKAKAMRVLKARLLDKYQQEKEEEEAEARKSQVGSGDRSERIRTYNFPQGRVTDHRINLTLHKLEHILEGEIEELIEKLVMYEKAELLQEVE
ncbi:peptide chain release factor 1 [Natranaerofaba carboxydovora]|uniref:peptide chain release factor 1 n=1 Tax=Natranaerofaba carboxydovora TaxID=2742683 RepID=UPI001F137464|nr:peptide chain release factor 1 [Natranaerofaba carboxydovora]UMZ75128.1 Peptide chain release factor 1 [Natranaerofaba carboxydovora]